MKAASTVFVLMLLCTFAFAQPVRGTLSPAKKLKLANQIYERGDTYNALAWFESVYEDDPGNTEILKRVADLQYELRDYERAESWFSRLVRRDKDRRYPKARFIHAKLLKINGNYEDAIAEFETFIEKNEDPAYEQLARSEIEGARMAQTMGTNDKITIANAGDGINSASTEQAAFPYKGKLYYSSLRSDSVIVIDKLTQDNLYTKLYVAKKVPGGTWGKGKPVKGGINKLGFHTTSASFTDEGIVYFTRCVIDGKQKCKIFRSKPKGKSYEDGKQVKLGEGQYSYKHPAVGEIDGKPVLFFISNMAGGYGSWDIYYAEIDGNDVGKPVNLGATVNTVGSEQSPFYQAGTLFYSTDGLPTIGGYDVFETNWSDGVWSKPVNMGSEVNSRTDDMFFSLDEDGYHGYVVSNRPGTISLKSETCCDDIYTITFLDRVSYDAKVSVFDSQTGQPIKGASVELREVSPSDKSVSTQQGDKSEYDFTLRGGKTYVVVTTMPGYYPDTSPQFSTSESSDATKITKKISLKPVPPPPPPPVVNPPPPTPPVVKNTPPPTVIREPVPYIPAPVVEPYRPPTPAEAIAKYGFVLPKLDTIYFDYDKYRVRSLARQTLDGIAYKLQQFPQLIVEVASHTDSKGQNDYNYRLSEKRTKAAIRYLKSRGIEDYRLVPTYYGEDAPVAPNTTVDGQDNPEGRRKNRRTEFRILEGVDANGQIRINLSTGQPTGAISNPAPTTYTPPPAPITYTTPTTSTPTYQDVYVESQPVTSTPTVTETPYVPMSSNADVSATIASSTMGEEKTTTLSFNKSFHDFGVVKAGNKASETFYFTNTGSNDLLIEFASGSCGCTVPAWDTDPIPPGGTGEIKVEFDSKDKTGIQDQEVTVIANTKPITTTLKIKATIE